MSPREDLRHALQLRRALLRVRDLEIARVKDLRWIAAIVVSQSQDAVRRAQELRDKIYMQRERAMAEIMV